MIKKLVTRKDKKKRQQRNQWILGAILIFVMFGSVFGIVVGSFGKKQSEVKIEYNGYEFTKVNNYYALEIGNSIFYFIENPNEISTLEREMNITKILPQFNGKVLYLESSDSTSSQEIYQNLNNYVERIQFACSDETTCSDENLPIKDCTNNFIIIKESENNKVYEQENCIFIEGKKEDLTKLTDEFLFNIIGLN